MCVCIFLSFILKRKKIKIPVLLVKGSDSERLLEAVGLPAYERMQAIHNSRVAAKAEL